MQDLSEERTSDEPRELGGVRGLGNRLKCQVIVPARGTKVYHGLKFRVDPSTPESLSLKYFSKIKEKCNFFIMETSLLYKLLDTEESEKSALGL